MIVLKTIWVFLKSPKTEIFSFTIVQIPNAIQKNRYY